MVIKIDNFIIKYSEGIHKFDLYRNVTLKSGNRKDEVVEKAEAYSTSLDRCCLIIADYRAKKNLKEIDLQTYVDQYKKIIAETVDEIDKISSAIKNG